MKATVFWDNVKNLLKEKGITQKRFAELINVSLGTFQGMMHYNRMPILDLAINIAKTLNVNIEYLISGNNKKILNRHRKVLVNKQSISKIFTLLSQLMQEIEKIQS